MKLPNGYEMQTTFMTDFAISDVFGTDGVKNTFDRAFKEWKGNYIYLTELVIVTNLRCWWHYTHDNIELSELYAKLYYKSRNYALSHLKGAEFEYFFNATD